MMWLKIAVDLMKYNMGILPSSVKKFGKNLKICFEWTIRGMRRNRFILLDSENNWNFSKNGVLFSTSFLAITYFYLQIKNKFCQGGNRRFEDTDTYCQLEKDFVRNELYSNKFNYSNENYQFLWDYMKNDCEALEYNYDYGLNYVNKRQFYH